MVLYGTRENGSTWTPYSRLSPGVIIYALRERVSIAKQYYTHHARKKIKIKKHAMVSEFLLSWVLNSGSPCSIVGSSRARILLKHSKIFNTRPLRP